MCVAAPVQSINCHIHSIAASFPDNGERKHWCVHVLGRKLLAVKLLSNEASTRYLFLFPGQIRWRDTCLCVTGEFNDMTFAFLDWSRNVPFCVGFKKNKLDGGEQGLHGEWRHHRAGHIVYLQTSPRQQLVCRQHVPLILLGSNGRWQAFSGEHFENECILVLLGRQRGFLIHFPLMHN